MLDDAGLANVRIVLSNDLDEHTIASIRAEGTPVDAWGVGTKLATAYDQPTLGGVYKLSAIRSERTGEWLDKLKISESVSKLTTPGILDVRRYYNDNGTIAGDMVFDTVSGVDAREVIVDPLDPLRQKHLGGKRFETLLQPLCRKGAVVLGEEERSAAHAREACARGLSTLDETQLRMLNPHTYPVGLERNLHERRQSLVARLRMLDD